MENFSSFTFLSIQWETALFPVVFSSIILLLLLMASALVSGSEVAFFSLSPNEKEDLSSRKGRSPQTALSLLEKPKELLAIILIANNFINVAIIIISSYLSNLLLSPDEIGVYAKFIIDVVLITFVLLLFGEVIPKIYAAKHGPRVSVLMALPLYYLSRTFPFSLLKRGLVKGTSALSSFLGKKKSINVSTDELEQALELTKAEDEDHKILEGIVKFGHKDVKQIMKARIDVLAFQADTSYQEIYQQIVESGYSRIPVYGESFDKIEGILYVKDLLPHIDADPDFKWQDLLREPYFVPENKKIDDLLKSFQEQRMHMAIVVDEYGGTSGIVTLEDILEEIVGDISDEFDEEDLVYSKLDDFNYVFEGKTALIDMYRVMDIDGEPFEEAKSESDTIAGFIIEQAGKILKKNERVTFHNYTFIVEAADNRKVKRVKVSMSPKENETIHEV
ncbi:MAG: gliding motility-associated protein GldE [Flavobacteriales bacterium]|nr:gliding motility-associated protein GldE [Flavobacteriales bacterium]